MLFYSGKCNFHLYLLIISELNLNMLVGITHTTSRMLQPPDYQLYEEQPKIKPPKSRAVLSVGLQPARSIAASHIKRRSLSASRLRTVNH